MGDTEKKATFVQSVVTARACAGHLMKMSQIIQCMI